jgi:hypothetical protein
MTGRSREQHHIEVTPAMIEAGVNAYFENAWSGWENPGATALREMMVAVFTAMSISSPRSTRATKSGRQTRSYPLPSRSRRDTS